MGNLCIRSYMNDNQHLVHEEEIPDEAEIDVRVQVSDVQVTSNQSNINIQISDTETSPLTTGQCIEMGKFSSFSFLVQEEVIEWVKRNKVMFIMRGLSGSGKSTLVSLIQKVYPGTIVCSADHFFIDSNGEYQFDHNKLKDAHNTCQNLAYNGLTAEKSPVVIDNTNVKRWEIRYYADIANNAKFNYRTILVEPKTPWRNDPIELATRNKHGVSFEYIQHRLKQYEFICPKYYGLFLENNTKQIILALCEEYLLCLNANGVSYALKSLLHKSVAVPHCTLKYFSKLSSTDLYHNKIEVLEAYGSVSVIYITGIFVTPRTIGLRVKLTEEQLSLWDNDDDSISHSLPVGSKAHVTVATASSTVPPLQCGIDLLNILTQLNSVDYDPHSSAFFMQTKWGAVQSIDNCYLLNFDEPFEISCLFTGFYT